MARGVRKYFVSSVILSLLIAAAGCSHFMFEERESWRHDAEIACLNSGAVKETPARVRLSAISGPGVCGMDYPIKVSALGDSSPLGYTDEPLRPPGAIADPRMPRHWPGQPSAGVEPSPAVPPSNAGVQSNALPALSSGQSP